MKNKTNSSLSLRKVILSAMVAAPLATLPAPLWALPSTASSNVTSSAGSATTFTTSGSTLAINTPDRSVLKWVEFGTANNPIGSTDTIIYTLPSSAASVLNMVTGNSTLTAAQNATTINGTITSNGQVLILNPNGIVVGAGANINTAGLTLSTVPETEYQYAATGALSFSGVATSNVVSNGTIVVGKSGNVFIAAKAADVSGKIDAANLNITTQGGDVRLAVSNAFELGAAGNPGYGNLTVTTNGGNVDVANAGSSTVHGNSVTLNTTGTASNGNVLQTAGSASVNGIAFGSSTTGFTAGNATVTISAPSSGTTATATATVDTNGKVTGLNITNVGSGYTTAPTITITGTGVSSTNISGGSGYTAAPTVTFSAPPAGGTTATGNATITGGVVTGITITNPGSGYTSAPTVTFTNAASDTTGTGAGATTALASATATVSNLNSAFTVGDGNNSPTTTITAGNGTINLTNVAAAGGKDFGVTINSAGATNITGTSNILLNTSTINGNLAVKTQSNSVASVPVSYSGAAYTTAPTIAISAPTGAYGVQATAVVNIDTVATSSTYGKVTGITITNPGSGYITPPTYTISGGAQTPAAVFGTAATISTTGTTAGQVTSLPVTYAGAGYTAAPTITIAAPTSGTTATAVATIDTTPGNNNRLLITITTPGSGYTSAPAFTVSGGTTSTTNITAVTGNLTVSGGGDIKSGGIVTLTGANRTVSLTAPAHKITYSAGGNLTFATNGLNGDSDTITATGNVVLPALTASSLSVTAATDITQAGALNVTGTATVDAQTGAVTLTNAANTIKTVVVKDAPADATIKDTMPVTLGGGTAATGNVTLTSAGGIQIGAASSDTISVAGNLTLVTTGNAVTSTAITGGTGASYKYAPTVTFSPAPAGGVTATATATIDTNGNLTGITITNPGSGYTAAPTVTLSGGSQGTVSVSTATTTTAATTPSVTASIGLSGITEASDNVVVLGNVNLSAPGSIVLAGSTGTGAGLKNQYGTINVGDTTNPSATNVKVFEQTTLNLGNITTTGDLVAYSATSIVNSGKLNIGGNVVVGAGTATAPGNINLDAVDSNNNGLNTITGGIFILDDISLLSGNSSIVPTATVFGNYLAGNVTVVVGGGNLGGFTLGNNIYGTASAANINLRATGSKNLVVGALNTTGTVSLTTTTGSITATNGNNTFTAVNVTSAGGSVSVSSASNLLVNATLTADASLAPVTNPASTASFTSGGNLTLGSITSVYNGNLSFTAGSKKTVSDTVAGLSIYGPVVFTGQSGVTINKSGHNFGAISVDTSGNNGNVVLVEGGTMNIKSIKAGKGNVTLTSSNQSIIQGGAISTTGNLTANASQGTVVLTQSNTLGNATVSLTASGNSSVTSSGALKFGTVTVSNGTFAGTASGDMTQSGAINVYGDTTLAAGSGNVSLTNTGNQFGGLIVSGANVALTESGTLNVKSIQTTTTSGTVALTSVNGSIVDTTDSTISQVNGISSGTNAVGAATFTANNGSVTLQNTASKFSTVSFVTGGNASIVQPTGDLMLGASTVGGALTVTTQQQYYGILQSIQGNTLNVTGNATFTTNGGTVQLPDTANQFGPVRFVVGGGTNGTLNTTTPATSTISENTTFNLNAGTVATAPVIINTNGNFITSGTGGSSFTGSLTINAIGTIIPAPGSMLVTGTFTVFSNNTKDLSGLSKSGNLAGKDPVNQGTGTYVPPSP